MKNLLIFILFCAANLSGAVQAEPDHNGGIEFRTEVLNPETLRLDWQIPEGSFLIRNKLRFQVETPGISVEEPKFPPGEILDDNFFGQVAVFRELLVLYLPLNRTPEAGNQLALNVSYQVCRNLQDCHPLHSEPVSITLPPLPAADPLFKSDADPLDVDFAFLFSARMLNRERILVHWQIADGYYLYRKHLAFALQNAPELLGTPQLPPGVATEDEHFGKVEVYYRELAVELPVADSSALDELVLRVAYRGCQEKGLCYAGQEKVTTFDLDSLMAKVPDSPLIPIGGNTPVVATGGGQNASFGDDDFLPVEEAFIFSAGVEDADTLTAYWKIAEGYYLYRHRFSFKLPAGGTLGEIQLPAGESKDDIEYGKVEVYYDQVSISLPLKDTTGLDKITLEAGYQGCAEAGLCYPPETRTVELALATGEVSAFSPAAEAPITEQDKLARTLKEGSLFQIIVVFFIGGLLLAFTPCVFPMIPILSGIIVGQGKDITTTRAFLLSLTYVLAMAATYTIAGMLAGLLGENLQAAFQNPWVLYSFAGVFVLLALSMFGFYDLQMPHGLQSWLNHHTHRQSGGTFIGVAIMGFLSALIVGPCVAPPLAAALIYIGQSGDPVLGGLALFVLSLGMGVPLLVIGTTEGKFLPRAGGWMDTIKHVFGILLLGVAIWLLERVVPAPVAMALWGALCIIPAIYLGALDNLPPDASGWRKFGKGIGFLLLLYGVLLILGAARGGSNIFQPLQCITNPFSGNSTTVAGQPGAGHGSVLNFKPIANLTDLEREVAQAAADNQTVMLDFYADWCVSCKEMEHYTFSDAGVQQALRNTVLLQADVTANNDEHKALMQHFPIYGPPGIIFYNRQGEEISNQRVVGFMEAEAFRAHVERVLQ